MSRSPTASGHFVRPSELGAGAARCYPQRAMATILLCGVDLFFRGKLDALLPGHHLVTTDSVDEPDLVIADIARVDPEEVADAYPEIPILGFTNHADTAGLRAAHEAGFDQVVAKSALVERVLHEHLVEAGLVRPPQPSRVGVAAEVDDRHVGV